MLATIGLLSGRRFAWIGEIAQNLHILTPSLAREGQSFLPGRLLMAQEALTLRHAAVRQRGILVDVLFILGGVALVTLAAQVRIPLPFTPVPITGQTFAVVLVGAGLGALRGMISLLLYVAIGLAGAPVFSGWDHGLAVLTGATGGYLMGFIVAAAITGLLAERGWDRHLRSSIGAMLTGNVIIYLFGLPWLAAVANTGLTKTLELGLYPFVPGDLIKLYLAAIALPGAWRLVGRGSRSI
jgi:biotin transport system substrate-specific component